jgi:hypothetical protein
LRVRDRIAPNAPGNGSPSAERVARGLAQDEVLSVKPADRASTESNIQRTR